MMMPFSSKGIWCMSLQAKVHKKINENWILELLSPLNLFSWSILNNTCRTKISDTHQAGGQEPNIKNANTLEASKQQVAWRRPDRYRSKCLAWLPRGQESWPWYVGISSACPTDVTVAGEYKATLKRTNLSDEAKRRAKQQLDNT